MRPGSPPLLSVPPHIQVAGPFGQNIGSGRRVRHGSVTIGMMGNEHPATKTTASVEQMAEAFYKAYFTYLNDCPKPDSIKIVLSHWALETGWGKSMRCYNVGNAKSREGDGYDYCFFACNEILDSSLARWLQCESPETVKITSHRADGKCVVWFYPKHPACRFRAFDCLYAGAYDHLKLLIQRFDKAWHYIVSPDVAAFSAALKAQRYYTADEVSYTKTLTSVFRMFDSVKLPTGPMFTAQERANLLNQVALSLRGLGTHQT